MRLPQITNLWPKRHQISTSSRGERSFRIIARAKWWPPFTATDFFAPRYQIEIMNPGEEVLDVRMQVAVSPWSGPLEDLPKLPNQWREVVYYKSTGPLKEGEARTLHVTIPTGLLDEGTHVVRLHLMAGARVGNQTHYTTSMFAWYREYLRVEPLSSVLTLLIGVGTLATAAATLVLVIFG